MKHSELKAKAFSNRKVKAAYDEMAPEFALLRQMLKGPGGRSELTKRTEVSRVSIEVAS
jgi:hypothetical protein